MLSLVNILVLAFIPHVLAKVTYFNLENTYGPYCNPNNKFTPDAGIIRYAGTPWIGRCVLNLQSCCLPMFTNGTLIPDLAVSTRFYLHLLVPPLCLTENITIRADTGEKIHINCSTKNGSEYYLDSENLQIIYSRKAKLPISKFSMIVTPMKLKTRMYTTCAFDCFSDIYCIDRSLVCDRYKNCPNNVDEANCEYSHQHEPLSFRAKILLFLVLLTIISFALASILICYFCCGVTEAHSRSSLAHRERKSNAHDTGAVGTPLLSP